MKRLRRWLFKGLAGLSLVLCLATCGLWVRSRWVEDTVTRNIVWNSKIPNDDTILGWGRRYGTAVMIASVRSELTIIIFYETIYGDNDPPRLTYENGQPFPRFVWYHQWTETRIENANKWGIICKEFSGFRSGDIFDGTYESQSTYGASDWLIVLTTAILPAIYAVTAFMRMRRKRNPFACRSCGYDLRATPERCPECGTIPTKAGI